MESKMSEILEAAKPNMDASLAKARMRHEELIHDSLELIDSIRKDLVLQSKNSAKANWGDVGDLGMIKAALEELRDML